MTKRNFIDMITQGNNDSYLCGYKDGEKLAKLFKKNVEFNFTSYSNGLYNSYINTLLHHHLYHSDPYGFGNQQPSVTGFGTRPSFTGFGTQPSVTRPSVTGFGTQPSVTRPSVTRPSVTGFGTQPSGTQPSVTCPSFTGFETQPSGTSPSFTGFGNQPSVTGL